MSNFYSATPDLKRRIESAPWGDILPALENDFTEDHELAPGSLEEAVEQIGMVLELVGEMSAEEAAPRAAEVDRIGAKLEGGRVIYPEPMLRSFRLLCEAGLLGFTLPREFGGLNLPITAYTAAVEIVGRADASLMTLFALQGCGETIHRHAPRELQEKWLPRLAAGEVTPCMALTEPNAGSALGSCATRATENGDGTWTIDGSKIFITNGGADLLLVLARSEESAGGEGLSLFLVERGPGVEVPKLEEKLGIHGSATAVVNFDGARGVLLGRRGDGLYRCTLGLLHNVRLEVAAQAVGIAQAAQSAAARYAAEREQFGRSIDHFAPVRAMLFENARQIEAARAIVLSTAAVVDRKRGLERTEADAAAREEVDRLADLLTPLSKYYACEMVNDVTTRALQVHGGYGYSREYPVERHLRDGRITNIYEGTSEIQVGAMIDPLLKGGVDRILGKRLADATEPSGCAGVLGDLRTARDRLAEAATHALRADRTSQQGWARAFADVTADLLAGTIFLADAARGGEAAERAGVLAREQAARALGGTRDLLEAVRSGHGTPWDDAAFRAVVSEYRSDA